MAMMMQMLHSFLETACNCQNDRARYEEDLQRSPPDSETRRELGQLMRISISPEQEAQIRLLAPLVGDMSNKRCNFMQGFGCFTYRL